MGIKAFNNESEVIFWQIVQVTVISFTSGIWPVLWIIDPGSLCYLLTNFRWPFSFSSIILWVLNSDGFPGHMIFP